MVMLVVIILVSAGTGYLLGTTNERTLTSTRLVTSTSTYFVSTVVNTTVTSTTTLTGPCSTASQYQGPGLPVTGQLVYYFDASVNYTGRWVATALVYNGSSVTPMFTGCFMGDGAGSFSYAYPALSNISTIEVTAQKVNTDDAPLSLVVNGILNSTNLPQGSTAVTAFVNQPCSQSGRCPLDYLTAEGYFLQGHGYVPLWGIADAYLFDCTASATTPQGCDRHVTSPLPPYPSYTINIRYPFANSTEPSWANCLWTVPAASWESWAKCVTISATTFVVGIPSPPPPPI